MCGIAAIVRLDGSDVDPRDIVAMTQAMVHRGPDDAGHIVAGAAGAVIVDERSLPVPGCRVALGNRRLSIIDLSAGGHQPMSYNGRTVVLNGEIYNYLELAAELRACGHEFHSHSDTEVLLHAYVEWGDGFVSRLNGIFAFAIWDALKRRLFCARDRLGVKPLYYVIRPEALWLSSEIKPLLRVLPVSPTVNEGAIYDFLATDQLDHLDESCFTGVFRLPAAHVGVVDDGVFRTQRYWDPARLVPVGQSVEENARMFHDLLHDAIRLQMRSDVPVGCCLSGGLDSSSVATIAPRYGAERMHVFTVRFADASMDEWDYASEVHKTASVVAHSLCPSPGTFLRELQAVTRTQEEPFVSPSIYVQWELMKFIHNRGVKVILDGQGSDEILCGYAKYFYYATRDLIRAGLVTGFIAAVLDALVRGGPQLFNLAGARRYLPRSIGVGGRVNKLLRPSFAMQHNGRPATLFGSDVRSTQILDVTRTSLPALLRYEDKNSMAHSVEARVPFLDHRLVEFCLSLPTSHKVHRSLGKYILRRALQGEVSPTILERRSKLGFGGSFKSWIEPLVNELDEWTRQPHRPIDRFVEPLALRRLLTSRDPDIFRLVSLDCWLREFSLA